MKQAHHRIWENVRHLPELHSGIKTLSLMGITQRERVEGWTFPEECYRLLPLKSSGSKNPVS